MTTLVGPYPIPSPGPPAAPPFDTVADLIASLGGIPADRIRLRPPPGTATEQDVLDVADHEERLCELVDGTLVEKPMGFRESVLALFLAELIGGFVRARNLGIVGGADGPLKLRARLVCYPDISFVSWARIPGGRMPTQKIPPLGSDLAVEVLSESNTRAEMERKRGEYFAAGGRLVWIVDPDDRTVEVYRPGQPVRKLAAADDALDGEDVLPGFTLKLGYLFAEFDRAAPGGPPSADE